VKCSFEHKGEAKYTLSVNTTGHEIYAFVNGKLAGEYFAPANSFLLLLYFAHQPDEII
jgi:hypothetical protein